MSAEAEQGDPVGNGAPDFYRFFSTFERDADGCFPFHQFGRLPSFCRAYFKDGDPSAVRWIDAWHGVVDSDDYAADFDRGRRHAEEAIRYARSMGRPGFIAIVLSAICLALRGNLMSSNTAAGFHARIAELASAGALN